jgi:hypothetical protein
MDKRKTERDITTRKERRNNSITGYVPEYVGVQAEQQPAGEHEE